MDFRQDRQALAHVRGRDIEQLTRAATEATFFGAPLTEAQIAANRRISTISDATCRAAAESESQAFVAAFDGERLAGYVIATIHEDKGHELDWLMVHPDYHGHAVSRDLMQRGLDWLGPAKPIWLTVIQHNERAIRFYEKFGFAIDPDARTNHIVPHHIMRRV
ncbi:MAG: GNAT family N-acetyltransferase [Hyphomonadaceae bacterium]